MSCHALERATIDPEVQPLSSCLCSKMVQDLETRVADSVCSALYKQSAHAELVISHRAISGALRSVFLVLEAAAAPPVGAVTSVRVVMSAGGAVARPGAAAWPHRPRGA